MLLHRRKFLQTLPLATASLLLPKFLHGFQAAPGGRILIILQLSGGNDGLNTVVPVRNDIYYRERPRLAIKREETLSMGDEAGLHPALTGMKALYDEGGMALLHSVGYPNPDRSHFRSMDIWHTASPADQYWNTGWLGRYLDAQCGGRPSAGIELDDTLSLALKGGQTNGIAMQDPTRLYQTAHSAYFTEYSAAHTAADHDAPVDYLYKTMAETLQSVEYIYEKSRVKAASGDFPDTRLGKHFRTIASLILGGADTPVYYLSHGSFDTHINQAAQQQRLFREMDAALAAFAKTMQSGGRWNEVLVVTFSEFGRRVAQNASGGTDHGAANQMFFLGGGLRRQGHLNALPDLEDLEQGDLKFRVDFRQVYDTLLQRWLGAGAGLVPGSPAELLDFV